MSIDQKIKNLRAALAELGQDTNQWTDADLLKVTLTGASRLPRWADQTPEQRLTECVARGERPETELLGEALNQAWAEARRHENAYTMLLQTQVQERMINRVEAEQARLLEAVSDLSHGLLGLKVRTNAAVMAGAAVALISTTGVLLANAPRFW